MKEKENKTKATVLLIVSRPVPQMAHVFHRGRALPTYRNGVDAPQHGGPCGGRIPMAQNTHTDTPRPSFLFFVVEGAPRVSFGVSFACGWFTYRTAAWLIEAAAWLIEAPRPVTGRRGPKYTPNAPRLAFLCVWRVSGVCLE